MGCRVSSVYSLLRTLDTDAIRKLTEVVVRAFCHQGMLRSGRYGPRSSGEPSQGENFVTCKWQNYKTTLILKITNFQPLGDLNWKKNKIKLLKYREISSVKLYTTSSLPSRAENLKLFSKHMQLHIQWDANPLSSIPTIFLPNTDFPECPEFSSKDML